MTVIPAAMFIEMAQDEIKTLDASILEDQDKELRCAIGAGATPDLIAGYNLGLQTARVLLQGMPIAVLSKVSL